MRDPGTGNECKHPVLPPRADPAVLHCQPAGAGGSGASVAKGFERLNVRHVNYFVVNVQVVCCMLFKRGGCSQRKQGRTDQSGCGSSEL
jgi:hypothetical protein